MMTEQRATDAAPPRQLHSGEFPNLSTGASRCLIDGSAKAPRMDTSLA